MRYNKARKIAQDFMNNMNPSMWDGNGITPSTFDDRILEYDLSQDVSLDISFQIDEYGWCHCCELVDRISNEMIEILTGYGIDSIPNLTNTIMDICKDFE